MDQPTLSELFAAHMAAEKAVSDARLTAIREQLRDMKAHIDADLASDTDA